MVLLGDEAQVDARFGQFRDSANLDARLVHDLRQTYHRLKWMLVLVCLDIVLTLTQDRCTVCAEHSIGSEIVLDAPDGSPM
jgi:hypothetical protein